MTMEWCLVHFLPRCREALGKAVLEEVGAIDYTSEVLQIWGALNGPSVMFGWHMVRGAT